MHAARYLSTLPALALSISLLPGTAVAAPSEQSGNLLNPSFEGSFESSGVATGWANWVVSGSPTYQRITSAVDSRRVQDGSSAQMMTASNANYQGGLQQTVYGLTPGATYRFSIWAHAWASSEDDSTKSVGYTTINLKVGIGQGLTYAADPGITWSGFQHYVDNYGFLSVDAVASGNTLTVFTYANPAAHLKHNDVYWDNASLTGVSSSSPAPPGSGATAAPFLTPFSTPTPDAEGKVVYIVQPGDTLIGIAWTAGCRDMACVEQIKALNGMTTSTVYAGQRIILATGASAPAAAQPTAEPAQPTEPAQGSAPESVPTQGGPAPAPTTGGPEPESTAVASGQTGANTGSICVMLYDDANGDAVRNQGEGLVADGKFTLTDSASGQPAGDYTTTGKVDDEPHCFADLPAGSYNMQVVPPEGYQTTTANSFALALQPGGKTSLEFGAQGTGAAPSPTSNSSFSKVLLAVGGVVFLMLAAGVAGFLVLTRRR